MALTKAKLIDSVSKQMTFPRSYSTHIVESFLEIIKHTLESGEDVLISGFGKFCVKGKKEQAVGSIVRLNAIVLHFTFMFMKALQDLFQDPLLYETFSV